LPDNPGELRDAVSPWLQGEKHPLSRFSPGQKLNDRAIEIMRFDQSAIIGATVEAVLRL
jgi:hypothetical protein